MYTEFELASPAGGVDEKKLSIAGIVPATHRADDAVIRHQPLDCSLLYWADSTRPRNTLKLEVAMKVYKRASDRCIAQLRLVDAQVLR